VCERVDEDGAVPEIRGVRHLSPVVSHGTRRRLRAYELYMAGFYGVVTLYNSKDGTFQGRVRHFGGIVRAECCVASKRVEIYPGLKGMVGDSFIDHPAVSLIGSYALKSAC
jgi:hypothetical protein